MSLQASTVFDTVNPEQRLIFYADKVALSMQEQAFFRKLEKDPSFPVLPKWWRQGDTLRFAHTVRLDIEKTKTVLLA